MVVVLDRLTKTLAEGALSGGAVQAFIPGLLDFRLVYNTGAAWGMFEGARTLFLVIAAVAVLVMVLYLVLGKRHSTLMLLGLGLIAGGAIGNTIDRALTGKVVDFIHTLFIDFPLFNIADSAITVGAILMVGVMLIFDERGVLKRKPEAEPDDRTQEALAAEPDGPAQGEGETDDPAKTESDGPAREAQDEAEPGGRTRDEREPGDAPL
jgi:signal peptidase II